MSTFDPSQPVLTHAKFEAHDIVQNKRDDGSVFCEEWTLYPVLGNATFDADGKHEDNDYARWTPVGKLTMTVNNPNLFGKIKKGDKVYLGFFHAE